MPPLELALTRHMAKTDLKSDEAEATRSHMATRVQADQFASNGRDCIGIQGINPGRANVTRSFNG